MLALSLAQRQLNVYNGLCKVVAAHKGTCN